MIDRDALLSSIEELKSLAEKLPNTPMLALAKINELVLLNMRLEPMMWNKNLDTHPNEITHSYITDTISSLKAWGSVAIIENEEKTTFNSGKASEQEEKHQALFQDLWVKFSAKEYLDRIERYSYRLRINGLADGFLKGKQVIDLGCGHGNFAHACIKAGANHVLGIDFGTNSIKYAIAARDNLGEKSIDFKEASIYKLPATDSSFDFAIQNGVFHHLNDENAAIQEAYRVLKPGGSFWYYTDGAGGIWQAVWDASSWILRDIPHAMILKHLEYLNISTNKRYHLGDGLNATYRHTTWEEITERLARFGFGNFKRLRGGYSTDFDDDVIAADRYGKEKFGSGDLRILAQKIK